MLTRYQRTVDALLQTRDGTTLEDFVISRDEAGVPGETIARQLAHATDGAVSVTGQAVRNWVRQFREQAVV